MIKKQFSTAAMGLEFSLLVSRTNAELSRRLDRRLGALHGISFVDFTVMNELSADPSSRMRRVDLADKLGLTQSAVTRILLPLEKIGLVSRHPDPNDARVGYAALTKTGRVLLEEARETAETVCGDLLSGITDEEFEGAKAAFRRIVR
ncbi:MAG TPA: MarR family transcriptional regulator [Terriglobales bacterium]|nr:MarR family transcriptional regulator [Terriglobales bacterium]